MTTAVLCILDIKITCLYWCLYVWKAALSAKHKSSMFGWNTESLQTIKSEWADSFLGVCVRACLCGNSSTQSLLGGLCVHNQSLHTRLFTWLLLAISCSSATINTDWNVSRDSCCHPRSHFTEGKVDPVPFLALIRFLSWLLKSFNKTCIALVRI